MTTLLYLAALLAIALGAAHPGSGKGTSLFGCFAERIFRSFLVVPSSQLVLCVSLGISRRLPGGALQLYSYYSLETASHHPARHRCLVARSSRLACCLFS